MTTHSEHDESQETGRPTDFFFIVVHVKVRLFVSLTTKMLTLHPKEPCRTTAVNKDQEEKRDSSKVLPTNVV